MYENHRDNFNHRNQDEDPGARWRRGEERYRRETQGDNRYDEDRHESSRGRETGYGNPYRGDDDYANRGGSQFGGTQRGYSGGRDDGRRDNAPARHWHEHDHDRRAGHPYSGTYGGDGDSSYFTGDQGSWAVAPSDRPQRSYAPSGQSFGADYRSHGYGARSDERGFWDRASDEVASWFGDDDAARRREMDHRGRGPKNYTRSDERIRDDANDRLTEDALVDASEITVTVQSGEITLDGTVHSRLAKRRAEDCVDAVSGVKHVQNNLRVQDKASGDQAGSWSQGRGAFAEGGTVNPSDTAKTTNPV